MWTHSIRLKILQNLYFTSFVNCSVVVSELHFDFWLAQHKAQSKIQR